MLRSRLPVLVFCLCCLGFSASASSPDAKSASSAGDAVAAPASPAPPSDLAPQAFPPLDFAKEFAQRLSVEAKLGPAEKADRAALKQFYEASNNQPVWVTTAGFSPAAQAVVAEIGRAGDWGLDAAAFRLPMLGSDAELTRDQRADTEIALSLAVLKYARHARGGRAEPLSISRNLDRKARLIDPQAVIETAAKSTSPDAYLRSLHPQHPQFERLRQLYLAAKRGEPIAPVAFLPPQVQGKAAKQNAAKAMPPVSQRALLANMEQWRWMPDDFGSFHVWVNIPEYTIRVVKAGHVVHSERVIVGRPNTQTPVFSDEMEQVIFHPFWGVPDSIKKNELLPSLARGNTGVLERNGLRIQYRGRDIDPGSVDWTKVDLRKFHVYQPPGSGNVLGVVKFRFPNKHDVYMHDTPTKGLFNTAVRTFSHGCMRVRDPVRLAEIVLAEDRGWPASRVVAAVRNGPKDNQINLATKIPVHMTYFTAWVEDDGKLRTYADIYGHENRIAMALSGKGPAPQVVAAKAAPARPKISSQAKAKRDWARRVSED